MDEYTFQMRYNMSANTKWFQKYKPEKSKEPFVNPPKWGLPYLNGFTKISFNFDGLYFWNHWEFGDILYLIWKVYSSFNRILIDQRCGITFTILNAHLIMAILHL